MVFLWKHCRVRPFSANCREHRLSSIYRWDIPWALAQQPFSAMLQTNKCPPPCKLNSSERREERILITSRGEATDRSRQEAWASQPSRCCFNYDGLSSRWERLTSANPGYHCWNLSCNSPLRTSVRTWSKRWAPWGVQRICCFLTNRLLMTWFTVWYSNVKVTSKDVHTTPWKEITCTLCWYQFCSVSDISYVRWPF